MAGQPRATTNGATRKRCPTSAVWKTTPTSATTFHGTDGPIPVWRHAREEPGCPCTPPSTRPAETLGFPDDPDMNHPDATGGGTAMPLNNPGGVRMSTAITYLDACRHRLNFTIRANVTVARRIMFDGKQARPE